MRRRTRLDHALGKTSKHGNVDAHARRWNHSEVGERRITSTDARQAVEYVPESVALGHLLHLRAGIGDGDEAAGVAAGTLEEILLEDVRFERRSRLAGDDKQRARQIDAALNGQDLRRVSGIEHVQLGEPVRLAEGARVHFRAEAGPAHTEQQDVRESTLPYVLGELGELAGVVQLRLDNIQPAEPPALIRAGPQRGIPGPKTCDFIAGAPVVENAFERRALIRTQREGS